MRILSDTSLRYSRKNSSHCRLKLSEKMWYDLSKTDDMLYYQKESRESLTEMS